MVFFKKFAFQRFLTHNYNRRLRSCITNNYHYIVVQNDDQRYHIINLRRILLFEFYQLHADQQLIINYYSYMLHLVTY